MLYSIIIPVYNRPDEIDELLESLTHQTFSDFEVVVVEDGSSISCESIVENYRKKLNVSYFFKPNSGPGQTRNYGAERSHGEYLIFFDSDCIIPKDYLQNVFNEMQSKTIDFWGGPDKAHKSFSITQKAIDYSMTSLFTTGGIRGGKKSADKFYPRSFNMGIHKSIFEDINGFSEMRFGEDIDLSIRILNKGFQGELILNAWVYHKRRVDFKKFYKQVFNSGMARINLYKKYPESLKLVHLFPCVFTLGLLTFPIIFPIYFIYFLMIFIDATIKTKSIKVGFRSIAASFVQLFAYGCGFIYAFWKIIVMKRVKKGAFTKTFYD
jgi:glycosyltransferase involved in cell wall biosynthesis